MRRLSLPLLVVLTLAACSSAPPRVARTGSAPATGEAQRTMPPGAPRFVDHSIGREEISIQAMSLVGIPYRWGGNTPESGFDCSGLVRYVVARAADVNLPRTTADISQRGESVAPDEVAPGDLIFFNTTGRAHSHVGIYVGKLRFVNAPSTGGTVRLDYLTNPYWAKRFDGIRRVAPPLTQPSPFDTPTYLASPRETPAPVVAPPARPSAPPRAMASMEASPAAGTVAATAPQSRLRDAADGTAAPLRDANDSLSGSVSDSGSNSAGASMVVRDPIDAAADAFEPPPPAAALAARQARRANARSVQQAESGSAGRSADAHTGVGLSRASTFAAPVGAPTDTSDDPIARFANGTN
jgi:hypothetical protein